MKLGVFDSGIGGEAIAISLRMAFPDSEIIVVNDRQNVPYGSKSPEQIITLTDTAIQPLLTERCDVIVIACNTATAVAIETLRGRYPDQPFVGLEPMIKPAASLTETCVIAVCATPATLMSERYLKLKETYANGMIILEPDCADWASMIEHDQIDEFIVQNVVADALEQDADVIVLACTHYHWIRETIEAHTAGRATILDPSTAIVRRISEIVAL